MNKRLPRLWRRPANSRAITANAPTSRDWRRTLNRRMTCAAVIFSIWAVGVEARLVMLQIMEHDLLVERAERQVSSGTFPFMRS